MKNVILGLSIISAFILTGCTAGTIEEVKAPSVEDEVVKDVVDPQITEEDLIEEDTDYVESPPYEFESVVKEISTDNSLVVEVTEELNYYFAQTTLVHVNPLPTDQKYKIGDKLKINFTGAIIETYPAQVESLKIERID